MKLKKMKQFRYLIWVQIIFQREYIFLIDQHAADERVRVERLTKFVMSTNGPNQRLKYLQQPSIYGSLISVDELRDINI